jgi:hypothetical protein
MPEVHAVQAGDQGRRDADHRDDGQYFDDVVRLDADEAPDYVEAGAYQKRSKINIPPRRRGGRCCRSDTPGLPSADASEGDQRMTVDVLAAGAPGREISLIGWSIDTTGVRDRRLRWRDGMSVTAEDGRA